MNFSLKHLIIIGICSLSAFVHAQTYPNRPVKLIVPLTPGSGVDIVARILAKNLSETWKQPVIVENRPGAGGLIGTSAVVNADPDGYTLLVQSASYAANPAIYKKLPYGSKKSLIDVSLLGITPYLMSTSPAGPYTSLKDLVIAAKERPGELAFASAGIGSSTHLVAEYFNQVAGIKMTHVPYKGGPEAIQDLIANRVAYFMIAFDTAINQVNAGKLRALGVTTAARSEVAATIPSIAEQGYPGFDMSLWFGLWAPNGTSSAIVRKINADVNLALQDREVITAYTKAGIQSKQMSPEEFRKFVLSEIAQYQKIVSSAKIEQQ
ncbi:tripartite tricarboxylate transporter substrate binding protein [Polynucleobacter sp. AP-Melu-500A-A1]|uniref:tripartite tricarboxylate transporter substrate binding protein n=1 Tax=Polynucleobacter sp. AP-Melu-500A-A1 TaxID=2576929 RepID=UPI001C0E2072|nr:tripartite tricarboxylate transporter substrate binding protein [Polynucleobacter sp. AP-Melu-500A-A1]MBU3631512.1 tripartite tricarboxylate transporter substrate binding protein [Polynucleobacter sp. AP-Melu-500A-A1]